MGSFEFQINGIWHKHWEGVRTSNFSSKMPFFLPPKLMTHMCYPPLLKNFRGLRFWHHIFKNRWYIQRNTFKVHLYVEFWQSDQIIFGADDADDEVRKPPQNINEKFNASWRNWFLIVCTMPSASRRYNFILFVLCHFI